MNETNISNWTMSSSPDRHRPFQIPTSVQTNKSLINVESPSKTSLFINEHNEKQNNIHQHRVLEFKNQNESIQKNVIASSEGSKECNQLQTDHNIYSNTVYLHPSITDNDNENENDHNTNTNNLHFDEKDKEEEDIVSMPSSGTTMNEMMSVKLTALKTSTNPITTQALHDTMDYTHKLMATIQQMEEHNNLKYKLRKYSIKIKKLERQLLDEKQINENKSIFLDKVNAELTQTNLEIERIEKEKRNLRSSLKNLEDIQQKYRLLEMKNLQLTQHEKSKNCDIDNIKHELEETNKKLHKILSDRDNISAVSEAMREELSNKRAAIIRYKEINKRLNEKIVKIEMNDINKLSDTMYSQPDATKLYHKMDHMEQNGKLMKQIKDYERKYNIQSRQFMQLKLENQSLKSTNNKVKKELLDFNEKLKATKNTKHKLLEEIAANKQLKKECARYQKELKKKNTDIQRLKSAMWNLNKFICSNHGKITEPGSDFDKIENMAMGNADEHNMTSLSFEHDLDLEQNVEIKSTKSNIIFKKKPMKTKAKYKTTSTTSTSTASSPDLLKEITKVVANQQRSRNSMGSKTKPKKINKKRIKQVKKIKNGIKNKRSFIPPSSNASSTSSRARRMSLNKKKNIVDNDRPVVKLASV